MRPLYERIIPMRSAHCIRLPNFDTRSQVP
jgi:hypothetical protein